MGLGHVGERLVGHRYGRGASLPNIHTSLSTHPMVFGVLELMCCICPGSASEFAGMGARNEWECHEAQIGELWPRGARGWWDIA